MKDVREAINDCEDARPDDITVNTIRLMQPKISPMGAERALVKIMNAHPDKYVWVTVYINNRRRSKALRLKES